MTAGRVPPGCAARYRTERELAAGGFGVVYRAEHVATGRVAVVKVLHGSTLEDPDAVARFLQEARITASLSHPHVVRVLDHDVEDGVPWIAYELVTGGSLRDRLASGPMPWREAARVAGEIADALEHVHQAGVLHRDIKPENVLLDESDGVRVTDFGIARWDGRAEVKTRTGVLFGSPLYIAPELLGGAMASAASDIYALGVTLFELLTARAPFQGELGELFEQHLRAPVPDPLSEARGAPVALGDIVRKAMAKTPAERFASAHEMGVALSAVALNDVPVSSETLSGATVSGVARQRAAPNVTRRITQSGKSPVARSAALSRPDLTQRPTGFRSRGALAGVAAVLIAGAAWMAFRSAPPHRLPVSPLPSASGAPSSASGAPASASITPARIPAVKLIAAHVLPFDDSVLVWVRTEPQVPLSAVITDTASNSSLKAKLEMSPTSGKIIVPGLRANKYYVARVVTDDGEMVIRAHPFKTLTANQRAEVEDRGREFARLEPNLGIAVDAVKPTAHPRLEAPMAAALAQPDCRSDRVGVIAETACDLRSGPLADALVRWPGRLTEAQERAAVVAAAALTDHPRAPALLKEFLASDAKREAVSWLLTMLDGAGYRVPFDDLLPVLPKSLESESWSAVANLAIRSDRARALAFFLGATKPLLEVMKAPLDRRKLQRKANELALADHGLQQYSDPDSLQAMVQAMPSASTTGLTCLVNTLIDQEAGVACAALGQLKEFAPPLDRSNMKILLRCPEARAAAVEQAGSDKPLRRAWGVIALAGYSEAGKVEAALKDTDQRVREVAAWSLVNLGAAAAAPALERAADPATDPRGVTLWALARLDKARARSLVLAALAPVARPPAGDWVRVAMAAWAAGDIDLVEAKGVLTGLKEDGKAPGFVRSCASESLSWMAGGIRPRTYLVPGCAAHLRTGQVIEPGSSVELAGFEIGDPPPAARSLDPGITWLSGRLRRIAGSRTWLNGVRTALVLHTTDKGYGKSFHFQNRADSHRLFRFSVRELR